MNISKIYKSIYIETKLNFNEENKNFEIFIFNPVTNLSYRGRIDSKNITIQNSTVENIHGMLLNCLENKENYQIEYWLSNFYFELIYKNDIFTIKQNITFDKVNDSCYKTNYELALVKAENEQMKQDLISIRQNYVSLDSYNQMVKNYESLTEKLANLTKEFDELKSIKSKDTKLSLQSGSPTLTGLQIPHIHPIPIPNIAERDLILEPVGFIPLGGFNFGPKTINNINNF